jgi:hypothetical protein
MGESPFSRLTLRPRHGDRSQRAAAHAHITLEQARHFMGALAKGGPESGNVILNTARSLVGSILPSKE